MKPPSMLNASPTGVVMVAALVVLGTWYVPAQVGAELPSQVTLTENPFAVHAAGSRHDEIVDLGIGTQRLLLKKQLWDTNLPDLTDPNDPRLDPAQPWAIDDALGSTGDYDVVATLRAESMFWGNSAINEALQLGLIDGIGLNGYPDIPAVWLAIVNKLVERYDGDGVNDHPDLVQPVRLWQIENEFLWQWLGDPVDAQDAADIKGNPARNQERLDVYATFLQETAAVIRSQDPNAIIISGGFTGIGGLAFGHGRTPPGVLLHHIGGGKKLGYCDQDPTGSPGPSSSLTREELLAQSGFQNWEALIEYTVPLIAPHVDRFDYHHYKGDWRYEQPMIEEMNAQIAAAGYSRPLMSLENAGPFFFYTIDDQASAIVKRYLLFIQAGGTRLFWSSMNPTTTWSLNFQNLSLLDCSHAPKAPPYYAYRELTSRAPVGATLTRHQIASSPTAVVFEVDPNDTNAPVAFVWEFDGNPAWIVPADIPMFSGEAYVNVANMTSATDSGLAFTIADATLTLGIGYDVLVLEKSFAPGDLDGDGDVDGNDFLTFSNCFNGSLNPPTTQCVTPYADLDYDGDVDSNDFLSFSNCFNGSLNPPGCQ